MTLPHVSKNIRSFNHWTKKLWLSACDTCPAPREFCLIAFSAFLQNVCCDKKKMVINREIWLTEISQPLAVSGACMPVVCRGQIWLNDRTKSKNFLGFLPRFGPIEAAAKPKWKELSCGENNSSQLMDSQIFLQVLVHQEQGDTKQICKFAS